MRSNQLNEIRNFFNRKGIDRNSILAADPIKDYEQRVRSRMVISMIDPKPSEVILDVGCGNGRDLIPLAKRGCRCIGIDLSKKMIEEARNEIKMNCIKNVQLEIGDATNLRYSDKMFDKVFASEVLEHIPDYHKAVSEMVRVLKTSGYLVITTPNRRSIYGFDRYIIYERLLRKKWRHPYDAWKTFDELASTLNSNGLKIMNVAGICYIPGSIISYRLPKALKTYLVSFVARIESWLCKTFPKNGYMIAIKAIKK